MLYVSFNKFWQYHMYLKCLHCELWKYSYKVRIFDKTLLKLTFAIFFKLNSLNFLLQTYKTFESGLTFWRCVTQLLLKFLYFVSSFTPEICNITWPILYFSQHQQTPVTLIQFTSETIPSACYVAYKRTWTEITHNDAQLYLEQQSVKDIGRPEQKCQLCYKLCDTPLTIVTKV